MALLVESNAEDTDDSVVPLQSENWLVVDAVAHPVLTIHQKVQ